MLKFAFLSSITRPHYAAVALLFVATLLPRTGTAQTGMCWAEGDPTNDCVFGPLSDGSGSWCCDDYGCFPEDPYGPTDDIVPGASCEPGE
jgi:hypothetical protein